jgi:predicted PurR-regulated permease PerM
MLAFWLNFIPNVGMATSVLLPMPLVLLDPSFGRVQARVVFCV